MLQNFHLVFLLTAVLFFPNQAIASQRYCSTEPAGYKVLPASSYEYSVDGAKECFFAFFVKNPDMRLDAHGDGNPGDAIWYAHYKIGEKPIEFAKPSAPRDWMRRDICDIEAISFVDIDGDGHRDITIIGTCLKSAHLYRRYFVFLRHNGSYELDEGVLDDLLGRNDLNIADIKKYIKYKKNKGSH